MLAAAMRRVYTALLYLAVPFVLLRLWGLGFAHGGYRERIGERFGFVAARADSRPLLWLHAVSVGEVQAAAAVVQGYRASFPDHAVLLTTTTPTGAEHARRLFGEELIHAYFPYDLPEVVARFLARLRPALLVLMETELWPNLLAACRARHIPAILANARLSPISARRYQRLRPLARSMLQNLTAVAAQTTADGASFTDLGLAPSRLHVTGSVKFDLVLPDDFAAQVEARRALLGAGRRVWIAASTHAGEEEIVLDAHREVTQAVPDALLLLAPRHPARSAWVADLISQRAMRVAVRSRGDNCGASTEVFLIDTLGELLPFYGATELAFVGGSLVPVGGHNLVEPLAAGVPVTAGPHVRNFAEMARVLREAGALSEVRDAATLASQVRLLMQDDAMRRRRITAGRHVIELHRGATGRLLKVIEQALAGH